MSFENRSEAGRKLAEWLSPYAELNPLVLAIPCGGVSVGREVADALGGDLDVLLVHNLCSPEAPELAIGSVAEDGRVYLSEGAMTLAVSDRYLKEEAAVQLERLRRRRAMYTPARSPMDPFKRIAIVVDDGLATGSTMIAALRAVRMRRPARLVAAVPVSPPETLKRVGTWTNQVVCLETHEDFDEVGAYYEDFSPVTDEEAVELLRAVPVDSPKVA
jgi:predicted phosphoribosyltransferase